MPLDAAETPKIDAMELVKLNVLHLHLSDNEGFRVESKLFLSSRRPAMATTPRPKCAT